MVLTVLKLEINSWLSRCSTPRGPNTGLFHIGPTKVKAHKSFLFIEGSDKVFLCYGIRWPLLSYLHQQVTVYIYYLCALDTTLSYFFSLCFNALHSNKLSQSNFFENEKIISQFVRTSKVCDQNGGRVFETD